MLGLKKQLSGIFSGLFAVGVMFGAENVAEASSAAPSMRLGHADLVGVSTAWDNYYANANPKHTSGNLPVGHRGSFLPFMGYDVDRLAKALRDDPVEIFNFVRNNIDLNPTFGLKGGGVWALYTGSGTAFDKADTLRILLKEAGYSPNFVVGKVTLSLEDAADWLGASYVSGGAKSHNLQALKKVFADGGIPADFSASDVTFMHVWIKVSIDSRDYVLDPSLVSHEFYEQSNLAAMTGLSSTDVLSDVGDETTCGTQAVACVTSVDKAGMRQVLNARATATVVGIALASTDVDGTYIPKSMAELTGDYSIVESDIHNLSGFPAAHPKLAGTDGELATWSEVADEFRTKITVDWGGAAATGYADELDLIGIVIPTGAENDQNYFNVKVDFPYVADVNAANNTSGVPGYNPNDYMDFEEDFSRGVAISYVLGQDPYYPAQGLLLTFGVNAEPNYASPLNGGNRLYTSGSPADINIITSANDYRASFFSWAQQYFLSAKLHGAIGGAVVQHHYAIGLQQAIYQEQAGQSMVMGRNYGITDARSGISVNHKQNTTSANWPIFQSIAATSAMLEGSVFAQKADMEPLVIETTAALFAANDDKGGDFYTITSVSQLDAVKSSLLVDFNDYAINWAKKYLQEGYHLTIAQYGNLGRRIPGFSDLGDVNNYDTSVFIAENQSTKKIAHSVFRGSLHHGFKGGGAPEGQNADKEVESHKLTVDPLGHDYQGYPEGVSLSDSGFGITYNPSGGYTLGSGSYPNALSIGWAYSSDARSSAKGLGAGWALSQDHRATLGGNGVLGLGLRNPKEGAAALVAFYAIQQTFKDATSQLEANVGSGIVLAWLSDHFRRNEIGISDGIAGQTYILSGAYTGENARYLGASPDTSYMTMSGAPTGVKLTIDAHFEGDAYKYSNVKLRHYRLNGSYSDYSNRAVQRFYMLADRETPSPDVSRGFYRDVEHFPTSSQVTYEWRTSKFGFIPQKITNNLGREIYIASEAVLQYGQVEPKDAPFFIRNIKADNVSVLKFGPNLCDTAADPQYVASNLCLDSQEDATGNKWTYKYYDSGTLLNDPAALKEVYSPEDSTDPFFRFYFYKPKVEPLTAVLQDDENASFTDVRDNVTRVFASPRVAATVIPETEVGREDIYLKRRNRKGETIEQIDPLGTSASAAHDALGRTTLVTLVDGRTVSYEYDAHHNVIKKTVTAKPGSGLADMVMTASYKDISFTYGFDETTTADDVVVTINVLDYAINAKDGRTDVTYYGNGMVHQVKGPCFDGTTTCADSGRSITTYTYTDENDQVPWLVETVTNPENIVTQFVYDDKANMISQTEDFGGKNLKTVYFYDRVGNVCRTVGPRGSAGLTGGHDTSCDAATAQ